MRTKLLTALLLLGLPACIAGCCHSDSVEQAVRSGENITYQCGNGDRIVAAYYSLSDDSLHFVKMILPDGRKRTLPQSVSASGARYTDDQELVWWIKGDRAILQTRDDKGQWRTASEDCRAVAGH